MDSLQRILSEAVCKILVNHLVPAEAYLRYPTNEMFQIETFCQREPKELLFEVFLSNRFLQYFLAFSSQDLVSLNSSLRSSVVRFLVRPSLRSFSSRTHPRMFPFLNSPPRRVYTLQTFFSKMLLKESATNFE